MEETKNNFSANEKRLISELASKLEGELGFLHLTGIDFATCPDCNKPNCTIQLEGN